MKSIVFVLERRRTLRSLAPVLLRRFELCGGSCINKPEKLKIKWFYSKLLAGNFGIDKKKFGI